jgi:hypothetical protein
VFVLVKDIAKEFFMKHGARLATSVCLAASVMLCLAALFFTATRLVSPAHAIKGTLTESIGSSPSSGPVGATISVSGSGWPDPDGEQVSFGYMIASYCSIVLDSQGGTLQSGAFSGWFHWPGGTPLATYTVCADVGSTTVTANTYTVLSESAPQISISPTTLTAGNQATITGSNYFPAGTTVQLFWQAMNGTVDFGIDSTTSNSNGSISRTFTVPNTTLSSGTYMILASVGGSQPPTLSSSVTFTYNATTPGPSPTPSPGPDPTPTKNPSPTATSVHSTPVATSTIGSTTPAVTQNTGTGQTPTSNTTGNGNTGNTTATDQPDSIFLIVVIGGSLVLLIAILVIALLIRRKKAQSRMLAESLNQSAGLNANGRSPWAVHTANGQPLTMIPAGPNGYTGPAPFGQGGPMNNGTPSMGRQSPQQMQYSPYMHLLQQPAGGSAEPVGNHPALDPYDPTLEAMKRQVQMGLYATQRQRRDERSLS